MARASLASIGSLVASGALLTACASTDQQQSVSVVAELSARVERVRQSAEAAGHDVDVAVKALQTIVHFDFKGDATAVFDNFIKAVEDSESQSNQLRVAIEAMKRESVPLFKTWEKSLETFSSEQMRLHSQERQAAMHERFDAIVTAAETAQVGCDAFNKTLRDHVAYLRYDFNAGSLAVIEGEVAALAQCAVTLATHFTTCEEAARTYVDSASLPSRSPTSTQDPAQDAPHAAADG
jgi:hypothetical protein